jgi:hypothetical protein
LKKLLYSGIKLADKNLILFLCPFKDSGKGGGLLGSIVTRIVIFFIVLSFLIIVSPSYAVTPVQDPWGPGGELNLYQVVNAMLGTSFTSSTQLGSYEVLSDDLWHEWNGHISIVATYAGYTQNLWWENNSFSGDIFFISVDGLHFYTDPPINFQTSGGDFYLKDITSGGTWYSLESKNPDSGKKHMVTYSFGNGIFICGFEDQSMGDSDYQDLVFKIIYGTAPVSVPAISYIPDQSVSSGYSFSDINLDNYVRDDDNAPAGLTWTTTGGSHISVSINPTTRIATITYPLHWAGTEKITYKATDPDGHFDSEEVDFTVNPPEAPVVDDIPNQTVKNGKEFALIYLDNYVDHPAPNIDDDDIIWSTSGGTNITVNIDNNRVAHISHTQGWIGSETITFTATVNPSSSNSATFTVIKGPGGGSVGGIYVSANKIALLSPLITLSIFVSALIIACVLIGKKKRINNPGA